jgi:hypothetical protein
MMISKNVEKLMETNGAERKIYLIKNNSLIPLL